MTDLHIFLTVLVIAAVTILTRVLPFAVFPENKKTPDFILYLGRVLPYSIMGMLVVYCFKSVSDTAFRNCYQVFSWYWPINGNIIFC